VYQEIDVSIKKDNGGWQWLNVNFILQEEVKRQSSFIRFEISNDLKERVPDCFEK
jgi:hypothetical protein